MKLLLAMVLLVGGGDFAVGLRAYREGDFESAYAAFTAAVEQQGELASAELLHDQALAAARLGMWPEMEAAATRAAERGGAVFAARRDFLRGNAAFARGQEAAGKAAIGDSGPAAWDLAIALIEAAGSSWQAAATSRRDWPEARRNAERALRALEELRQKREQARRRQGGEPKPPAPPSELPPTTLPQPPDGQPPSPEGQPPVELSAEEMQKLLEQLARQERDKQEQRRARRAGRRGGVERDW